MSTPVLYFTDTEILLPFRYDKQPQGTVLLYSTDSIDAHFTGLTLNGFFDRVARKYENCLGFEDYKPDSNDGEIRPIVLLRTWEIIQRAALYEEHRLMDIARSERLKKLNDAIDFGQVDDVLFQLCFDTMCSYSKNIGLDDVKKHGKQREQLYGPCKQRHVVLSDRAWDTFRAHNLEIFVEEIARLEAESPHPT